MLLGIIPELILLLVLKGIDFTKYWTYLLLILSRGNALNWEDRIAARTKMAMRHPFMKSLSPSGIPWSLHAAACEKAAEQVEPIGEQLECNKPFVLFNFLPNNASWRSSLGGPCFLPRDGLLWIERCMSEEVFG